MSNDLCSPFNCNICLMFKAHQEEDQNNFPASTTFQHLLTCNGCQLVKYCSKEHQKLDWPLHHQFCQAVQKIKKKLKIIHPFYINGVPQSRQEVETAVIQIKYLLKNAFGRSLEYQEEELSSFPAFCGQCFKLKNLKFACTKCCSQVYCSEQHQELHRETHDKICSLLQIYYCPFKVQPLKEEICMQFGSRVEDLHKRNLFTCIEKTFALKIPLNPCENLQTYQIFSWAADFSCITTICFAMELLKFQKHNILSFNIFILGASIEAVLWFREVHCKLFFSQNPQVMELELNFIGPEVVETNYKELRFLFLGDERLVKLNFYKGLFQEYCKFFKIQPSLIVVFNCGFSEFSQYYNFTPNISNLDTLESLDVDCKHGNANDTWYEGIVEILQTFDTPIVFTSFTEQESEFDFAALQNAAHKQCLKVHIDRIIKVFKNPFRDLRPLRQWYSSDQEEFYFRNGYIQAIRTRLEKEKLLTSEELIKQQTQI